jgi:hypothetical protein
LALNSGVGAVLVVVSVDDDDDNDVGRLLTVRRRRSCLDMDVYVYGCMVYTFSDDKKIGLEYIDPRVE